MNTENWRWAPSFVRRVNVRDWVRVAWDVELLPDPRQRRTLASYGILVFRVFIGITWSREE